MSFPPFFSDLDSSLTEGSSPLSLLRAPSRNGYVPSSRGLDLIRIREVAIRYQGPLLSASDQISKLDQAAAFARKVTRCDAREHFHCLYLDGRHRPIAYSLLSLGSATASLVHPREVYQPAVLLGAVAIVALHNHPSGDPRPSTEDRDLTKRLAEAGRTIGIELLDHVVWTKTGAYRSLRDESPELFATRLDR